MGVVRGGVGRDVLALDGEYLVGGGLAPIITEIAKIVKVEY
jgi:hypothetical protein